MAGSLLITRDVKNHSFYKKQLEKLGFSNVKVTALEKDGLNILIREMNPDLVMMMARFYECATPYMMGELKKDFPKIKNWAALSLEAYPPDLAMYFILNGIKSYSTASDGFEEYFESLKAINRGRTYISQSVQDRLALRDEEPAPAGKITARHIEVIRLVCCGLENEEIAQILYISRKTVYSHKREFCRSLNVRNDVELLKTALKQKMFTEDELFFYPKKYTLTPLPDKAKGKRAAKEKGEGKREK